MKIVFDYDGVLDDLFFRFIKKFGIRPEEITCYELTECSALTKQQKHEIIDAFHSIEHITLYDCLTDVNTEEHQLFDYIIEHADVYIHSLCMNTETALAKRMLLKRAFPNLKDNNFILENVSFCAKKELKFTADILVEDKLDTIIDNTKVIKQALLIDYPYNRTSQANEELYKIKRMCDLKSALNYIADLLGRKRTWTK